VSTPTPATQALSSAGIAHRVHRFRHDQRSSKYGSEVAATLDVEPDRIFKTLIADAGGEMVVALVPVTSELDLKALAAAVGAKSATMTDITSAERATGYLRGGISPVGQKRRLRTIVDTSMSEWPTVFVSAGRRGLELEVEPADLLRITSGLLVHIARGHSA
jgi:Cys-tRNA(Pro)/Cys-tRNA(Cys) deacylase